jgi:uncharacterized protein YlxW (UPF0749 family)
MALLDALRRWGWAVLAMLVLALGFMFYSAAGELAEERAMRKAAEAQVEIANENTANEAKAANEARAARTELQARLTQVESDRAALEVEHREQLEALAAVPDWELAARVNELLHTKQ